MLTTEMLHADTFKVAIISLAVLGISVWYGFRISDFTKKESTALSVVAVVIGTIAGLIMHNHPGQ